MQQYTLQFTIGKRHFSSGVFYCLFAVCAVSLCLSLSYWQWQRAQAADQRYLKQQSQQSIAPAPLTDNPTDYQRVEAEGWIKNIWFLDNKILNQNVGRVVLAELHTQKKVLLANLGWQPLSAGLTSAQPVPEYIKVSGILKQPSEGFSLMDVTLDPDWPVLQQQIDITALETHIGYVLYPYILHSDTKIGQWENFPITIDNKFSMHSGYAIQWMLLALVALVMFMKISLKKHPVRDTKQ